MGNQRYYDILFSEFRGLRTEAIISEMAGNIIPAIATTNAIIAGIIVLQALQLLKKNYTGLRNVHLQRKAEVPLNSCTVGLPPKTCAVCRDTYTELLCDPERTTLAEAVNGLLGPGDGEGTGPRDIAIYEDKRLLADPDFDDNMERTLASLGVTTGKCLTIVDEDSEVATVAAAIGNLPYVPPLLSLFPSHPLLRAVPITLKMAPRTSSPSLSHFQANLKSHLSPPLYRLHPRSNGSTKPMMTLLHLQNAPR